MPRPSRLGTVERKVGAALQRPRGVGVGRGLRRRRRWRRRGRFRRAVERERLGEGRDDACREVGGGRARVVGTGAGERCQHRELVAAEAGDQVAAAACGHAQPLRRGAQESVAGGVAVACR